MKSYISPQIDEIQSLPSTIIAVSVIKGGTANPENPVQVKEEPSFSFKWDNVFSDENTDLR